MQVVDLKDYFPEERIVALADGDPASETLDALEEQTERNILTAIAAAETEADGYLRGRYVVPVSPVSGELKRAVAVVAIYNLFRRKPEFRKAYRADYDLAVEWLEGVSEMGRQVGGEVSSGTTSEVETSVDGAVDEGIGGVFAGGGLGGF